MTDLRLANPDIRLQFALAKVGLNADERARVEELARQATDWNGLFETAGRNFSLPIMRRHLRQMPPGIVPEGTSEALNEAADASAIRNMELIVAQKKFVEDCLAPLGIEGLFFKGISIASQYYPDFGLRPCRDIDILLPKGSRRAVTMKAIEQGYRLVIPRNKSKALEEKEDLEAALYYRDDANLLSEDGVAIDLQERLDKYSGIFSAVDVFAQAVPMKLGGMTYLTMPTQFLFNYICHHHARHTWSYLHWLSDLDAMVTSPGFNREAALSLADELGQRGTVEGSLEMQRLMSPLASWEKTPETRRGLQFIELCLRNLPGDLALEKHIAMKMIGGEFMFDWQARPDVIRRARWTHTAQILKPTVQQYVKYPMPRQLRWLYVIPRLVDLIRQARVRTGKRP